MLDAQITFIYVADLDRSHEFYHAALGLDLVLDQGRCRIYQASAAAYIGVCDTRAPVTSSVILTLVTDDVDAMHLRLRRAGAPIDVAPRANPEFGIYQLFSRDPDGYVIEVQRFDDPSWATNRSRS